MDGGVAVTVRDAVSSSAATATMERPLVEVTPVLPESDGVEAVVARGELAEFFTDFTEAFVVASAVFAHGVLGLDF
jgi:hypothetical protein